MAVNAYRAAAGRAIRPDRTVQVADWADQHRWLTTRSSPAPGQWQTSRTPYLRDIMNDLSSNSPIETVIWEKSAQIGATEAGSNWVGYVIHHAPGPMMLVQPTVEMAKRNSK